MKTDKMKNEKQYALVTGATSGIGYELAKLVVKNGYNAILVARDEQELKKVSDELSQFNTKVSVLAKDLFDPYAAEEIYEHVQQMGVSISVLINDAGQGQYGKFIETELERQLDIIQLNVNSLVSLTHYFLKDMVTRNEGKILQLGSELSKQPAPLNAIYGATKAFVLSFTEALVNELKDTNVTITLLMPGATDTDFFNKADAEDTKVYREGKLESPADVALSGFEGMMKGDRRVIASNAKRNVAMASVMPDNMIANNLRKQMEPPDEHTPDQRTEPKHQQSLEQ